MPLSVGQTPTRLSVHATEPVCQLGIHVTPQDGETVLEGEAWCYTFSPEPSA